MRYGVLGGSFDPIHKAHVALAHAAVESLGLDEVIFIPAARNPHKEEALAPSADRMAMVQLAIEGEPKFSASDIEISRGGRSYAYETLQELSLARPGQYWFLLGTDALRAIETWRHLDRIIRLCRFGVAVRPPMALDRVLDTLPEYIEDIVDPIEMPEDMLSSSKIRGDLARGLDVSPYLHPSVDQYIQKRGLYTI